MLILMNPMAEAKDQIWVNPAQITCLHPVHERQSTADPTKTLWYVTVDMSNGYGHTVGYDRWEAAKALQDQLLKAAGAVT